MRVLDEVAGGKKLCRYLGGREVQAEETKSSRSARRLV